MTDYQRELLWQEESWWIQEEKDPAFSFASNTMKHHNTSFLSVLFHTKFGLASLIGLVCKDL